MAAILASVLTSCGLCQSVLRIQQTKDKWRERTVERIDPNLSIPFKEGPGNIKYKNILKITEDFGKSDEFLMMSAGGTLPVPVLETRSMKMPVPDKRDQYKWPKEAAPKTIDCEDMSRQLEDIWDDMVRHYKELVDKGVSEVQARAEIKKSPEYNRWNGYNDKVAEISTKEKFVDVLKGLPSIVVRSVMFLKKAILNMQKLGLLTNLPKNEEGQPVFSWEADLMAAYVCEGKLRVVLGEVKRNNTSPGDRERILDRQTINNAFNQLRTDLQFLQVNRCWLFTQPCFHTCGCLLNLPMLFTI
jgi:hypothetical protein